MINAAKYAIKKVNWDISLKRGWISVLHTWGSDLSYHLHLHVLITNDGLDDKQAWQENSIDVDSIRKYYQKSIRKKLSKALKKYWLDIPPGIEYKDITKTIRSKQFYIQQAGIYANGEGVLKYFSKKLKTGALNHKQVISYDDKSVTFYYMQEGKKEIEKLKREELIGRYLNHIPFNGFRIVRNYGLYSTRQINKTIKLKEKIFGELAKEIEYTPKMPKCPVCGKELSIIKKCSAKEFKDLFTRWRKVNPGRPPPGHYEYITFSCIAAETSMLRFQSTGLYTVPREAFPKLP